MRKNHLIPTLVAATVCTVFSTVAGAADITMLEVSDGGGDAHVLLDDWGWSTQSALSVFAEESWMSPGEFSIDVDVMADDAGRGSLLTIPTDFAKKVTNVTTYDWNEFTTTIIPSPGATIASVVAQPNAEFGNVNVVDNGDGSYSITWDSFGGNGTGVPVSGMTTMDFSFEVTGPSSELVNYKLRQAPTPEPVTAILLGAVTIATLGRRPRRAR